MNCRLTKFVFTVVIGLLATGSPLGAQEGSEESAGVGLKPNASITSEVDEGSLLQKSSYIIGYNMTSKWLVSMQDQGIDFDTEAMVAGMAKAVTGEEIGMAEEEIQTVMMAFQKVCQKNQVQKMKTASEANRIEGEAYLVENAKKEGVKKLDNGVQYEVLTAGTGETPTVKDTVSVHYKGMLPNGDVFDTSLKPRGGRPVTPAEFPVGGVVPGFSSALQAMKVGDKWKVTIPSDLAYGVRGPGAIGPNRTLIFEIELLGIVK